MIYISFYNYVLESNDKTRLCLTAVHKITQYLASHLSAHSFLRVNPSCTGNSHKPLQCSLESFDRQHHQFQGRRKAEAAENVIRGINGNTMKH